MRTYLALTMLQWTAAAADNEYPQPTDIVLLTEARTLTAAETVAGVAWPAGATLQMVSGTHTVHSAFVDKLSSPWVKGGVTWPAGSRLSLNARGEVEEANRQLTAAETVAGTPWPTGTFLSQDRSGRVTTARRQVSTAETVNGLAFPSGSELVFDGRGRLLSATVVCSDQSFANVRWKKGTRISVYEDGKLDAWRQLDRAETIQGVAWAAGTRLRLDARGRVVSGSRKLDRTTVIGGVSWPADTELELAANGKVTGASIRPLSAAKMMGGRLYPAGMWLEFDPATGKVLHANDPRAIE